MNDQTQPPVVLQTAEEAIAEVRAGNVYDLDDVLDEMRRRIDEYVAKRNHERGQRQG